MIFWIRLLRPFAMLVGITGALIKLNASDPKRQMFGIGLAVAGFLILVMVYALSGMAAFKQKPNRHRR